MSRRVAVVVIAIIAAACTGGDATTQNTADVGTTPPDTSVGPNPTTSPPSSTESPFDPALIIDPASHSAAELPSVAAFAQMARNGIGGQQVTKFSITDFSEDPTVEWLDSNFYALHDEWYWFQLLNGDEVSGFDVEPVNGLDFADVADVYEWADEHRDDLPLDLRFTSLERLYSPSFYRRALDDSSARPVALGSIIRLPASGSPERAEHWLMELEYRDTPDATQIAQYFTLLLETLPDGIGDELLWVPRSREQEIVADEMAATGAPFGDRTIRFEDLVVPGETQVYAEGVAAGRLLLVTDDGRYSLSDAGPDDIVVVQRTPDALPPGNALVTGTPQTPLSHVNVLALNRGIPNVFLGGLVDHLQLNQLGRVRAPVAIRAVAPDHLEIRALTDNEFDEWSARRGAAPIAVPTLDVESLPLTLDLDRYAAQRPSESGIDMLRPVIGGKAAGFLGLAAPGTVTMPDRPLAITVRPYFEHIAQLDDTIAAMLASTPFETSARSRFVLLAGPEAFAASHPADSDASFLASFIDDHPQGTALGDIVAAGGLQKMIEDINVDPDTVTAIEAALSTNFADFAPTQGLRFRSSSSVEDIEGFNGAGLYTSNTGYIDPTVLPDDADHKRTVERAIKRTWSSYWNVAAVEERIRENVDHRSGGMAILVHARFDDSMEISNGVATFTILPDHDGLPEYEGGAVMHVNVQAGDTSVTNPDNEPGQTAEIVEMRQQPDDTTPTTIRIVASSLLENGDVVLNNAQLNTLWTQLRDVTVVWMQRINDTLATTEKISTLTLDFEFREMAAEWPAIRAGSATEAAAPRIVIKQARTLEPGLRGVPDDLIDLAAPRDVLARTTRAIRITCPNGTAADDVFVDLFTDPLASVDMGFSVDPYRVTVSGSPTRVVDETCTSSGAFASADAFLQDLFAARQN